MHQPAGDMHLAIARHVGVRQIGGENRVVLAHSGAQKQRPVVGEKQLESRQEAGAGMVKAVFARGGGNDIAVRIEDGEAVAAFQDTDRSRQAVRLAEDGELIREPHHLSHQATPVVIRLVSAARAASCDSYTCR